MPFPGKFPHPFPLTHVKEKYYHEVAVMPKNIGGRETGMQAPTRKKRRLKLLQRD
jgi:hypothetical protein